MTVPLLFDLDELVQTVRDPQAKAYISEALQAYRAGAYRAAIISTWIATAYDLIGKLRELASGGDRQAREFVVNLDQAIEQANLRRLQETERELLTTCRDGFDLLSASEAEDLRRLQLDRNLCAHPAFVSPELLFQPVPEAVRTHIVHAVRHVLAQRPVQGKYALNRLREDLKRLSFPRDTEEAFAYMHAQYLGRAKDSLVRNLVTLLLKTLLRSDDAELRGRERAMGNALRAVSRSHYELFREVVRSKLNGFVEDLPDPQLPNLCAAFAVDGVLWEWLSAPMKLRVKQYVQSVTLDGENGPAVMRCLLVPELASALLDRLEGMDWMASVEMLSASPHPSFIKAGLSLYRRSRSFRGSEWVADSLLAPLLGSFSPLDVISLLEAARENNQIWYAGGTAEFLDRVFEETGHLFTQTAPAWVSFVERMRDENGNDAHYSYPRIGDKLIEAGLLDPPAVREEPEISTEPLPF
jgi:hypothetical protein